MEIIQYLNGNTHVTIFDDGTKIRTYELVPKPNHPETMDVKITNFCTPEKDNPICSFCHEMSTPKGLHGNLYKLMNILDKLPPGIELALGGGNVLSHPDLFPFLLNLKKKGFISNITVNEKHIEKDQELIFNLIDQDLIKGIGISYSSPKYLESIKPILMKSNNVVFHLIVGLNITNDIKDLDLFCSSLNKKCKILLLGYKRFGFGINHFIQNKSIENNKYEWMIELSKFFNQKNLILSFDNLAIDQLKLKRFFTDEGWNKFYMGEDGTFSMYIDAVKQEFAKSSISNERISFEKNSLIEFFKNLKGN